MVTTELTPIHPPQESTLEHDPRLAKHFGDIVRTAIDQDNQLAPQPPLASSETPPPTREHRKLSLVQRIGQKASAATLAIASLFSVSAKPHTAPEFVSTLSHLEITPNYDVRDFSLDARELPGEEVTEAQPPDPYTLKVAGFLLRQPSDPEVEKQYSTAFKATELTNRYGPYADYGLETHFPVYHAKTSYNVASEAARQHNQVVYDSSPYIKHIMDAKLQAKQEGKADAPFSVYYDNARDYLAQFGVTFSIEDGSEPLEKDRQAVTAEMLEASPHARQNMLHLIEAYSMAPQAYVDLANLRHIRWMSKTKGNILGYAGYPDGGIYYIDILKQQTPDVYAHEHWHLISLITSGKNAVYNDPYWDQLTPTDVYSAGSENNVFARNKFQNTILPGLNRQFEQAVLADDLSQARAIQTQINQGAAQVNMNDNGYGGATGWWQQMIINGNQKIDYHAQLAGEGLEDSAENGKDLTDSGAYIEMAANIFPILTRKFVYNLATIGTYDPALMGYLLDIGRRRPAKGGPGSVSDTYVFERHLMQALLNQAAMASYAAQFTSKSFSFAENPILPDKKSQSYK